MSRRVAHKIKWEYRREETRDGIEYIFWDTYYICGKVHKAFIEKADYKEPTPGWLPNTTICKKCAKLMDKMSLDKLNAQLASDQVNQNTTVDVK